MPVKEKRGEEPTEEPTEEPQELPVTPTNEESEKGSTKEFLVLSVGLKAKVGISFKLIGVARSLEKAKNIVESISDTGISRVAIAEKKIVLSRRPAIAVEEVDENIIKD